MDFTPRRALREPPGPPATVPAARALLLAEHAIATAAPSADLQLALAAELEDLPVTDRYRVALTAIQLYKCVTEPGRWPEGEKAVDCRRLQLCLALALARPAEHPVWRDFLAVQQEHQAVDEALSAATRGLRWRPAARTRALHESSSAAAAPRIAMEQRWQPVGDLPPLEA